MQLHAPHAWDVKPAEARAIQAQRRGRIVAAGEPGEPGEARLVAGVDISAGGSGSTGLAAVVLLAWPGPRVAEQSVVEAKVRFPYVPGLLSFREPPLLAPACGALKLRPDLVVVAGQGVAHPHRFGLASQLGLLLGLPTIGRAKPRLVGACTAPEAQAGASSPLRDGSEVIGTVLWTKRGVKPVYVSVGHQISLEAAAAWLLRLTQGYRLPEPTRLAHRAAAGEHIVAVPT